MGSKETVLVEAGNTVDAVRQGEYGHPAEGFAKVASAARALGLDPTAGPLNHALYMILLKITRLLEAPNHRDSLVDIAGYARTYEKVLEYGADLSAGS